MKKNNRDLVLEDLEKARAEIEQNPDKEPEKNSKTKKTILLITTTFLIILMLSFIYLSAPVYTYIYGLAGSSKLKNNEITFKNTVTVIFEQEILEFLQQLYNPIGDERALCLKGELENNTYTINSYYKPIIYDRAWNFVSHSPCQEDTLIMFHTHPFFRCEPSRTDRNTLRMSQINNPEVIMLVMCGPTRFSAVI